MRQTVTATLIWCILSCISFTSFSQSPGGVNTNLQLWFKANAGAEEAAADPAEDTDPIEFWRDQSGNFYDASQGVLGDRPTLDLTNTINGNPVFVFSGTDHFPIVGLNYPAITTPAAITVFSVLTTTSTSEGIILSYDRNEYFRFATDHDNDGGFGLSTTNSSGTISDFDANGTPEDDGVPHILGANFDPGVAGVNKHLYFDGTVSRSVDAGTTAFGTGTTRFGFIGVGSEAGAFDGGQGPSNNFDGNMAEIIYYAGALTPTQRQQVESYLAIKYGITLSSDTDGDATAFEAGEGDYIISDGTTVIWDASVNQSYHNDVAAIANDVNSELTQTSSKSINAASILSMTDNSLADGDFVVWGNNAGDLTSAPAPTSTLQRILNRVWNVEITGATDNIDDITFDLSSFPALTAEITNFALLIDDNASFSTPIELTSGTLLGSDLSFSNVDFSSFGADVFVTLAFDLPVPGGVADDLTYWFKGDAGVEEANSDAAEDGDAVQFWRDQAGNGYDAQQNDSGERPTLETSAFNFNPALTFDGSTHLPIRDLNYDITTNTLVDFTIYSVARSSQTSEGIIVSYDRSSFFRFGLNQNGSPNFGLGTAVAGDIDDFNGATTAEDGQTHLIGADYSATSNTKNLFLDGALDDTRNAAHSPSGAMLGSGSEVPRFGYIAANSEASSFNGSDNGSGLDGSIAEIIYFESILTAAERGQVESYLGIKYGITLSGNYVASDGATVIWDNAANTGYNNMIAAVGLDVTATLDQNQSKSENTSSILTISDAGLTDGDYVFFGNDDADLSIITSGTGTRDGRYQRIWKFQLTGSTTSIDELSFDLSSIVVKPAVGDYRLLIDDNAAFSSPTEVSATSLVSDVLSFTNVDLAGETFITIALDPDLDLDGVADADDLDDDNDGIPDTDEGSGLVDTDSDGIFDSNDLDSDNDGILDLYESGAENAGTAFATLDANSDGVIDAGMVGTNGLDDRLETVADNAILAFTISNVDGDTPDDFRDLDADNDGIGDLVESGQDNVLDSDDDGVFEGADVDLDGIVDLIDTGTDVFGSVGFTAKDQDGTGEPDFRDLDSDDDLVEDVDEVGLTDTTPDDGRLDGATDAENDGILAGRDDDEGTFGGINLADLASGSGDDWYSYRSGDWNDPDNWTLDPSGSVRINPNTRYPNNINENVTILNGDEMTLNFNSLVISSLTLNTGGVADLGTTINHDFTNISGSGTIRIATDNFPAGVLTDFISTSGGTVEYTDQSPAVDYELSTARTFNNMIVNSAANSVVLKADYTLNSDLTVASGTLQINDNTGDSFADNLTPLNFLVNGNVTIDGGGVLATGDVDASSEIGSSGVFTFHQFEILGDFTNNGSATFTNLSPTSVADGRYRDKYPTGADADNNTGSNDIPAVEFGAVEVLFTNGAADQLITLNGTTDFYRIEIAKGTSQTFIAEINASSTANFRLLGRIAMNQSDDSANTPNIDNNRALGLEAGILKLGDNIVITEISKDDNNGAVPSTQGGNRNYIIDLDAQLWLAGNSILTRANSWGIHPFGKLKVSDDATLTYTGTGQRTILVDNQGVFEMTGGTVDITQYRNKTGSDGAPRGSFIMTGGTMNIGQGSADGNHAVFSVPWEDQNFILSAADLANPPEINITLDASQGKDNTAVQIGVKEGNYNIGESEINIIHTSNTNYKFVSTAPLYNLSYNGTGTGELIIEDIDDANDTAPGAGGILPDDNSGTTPSPAQFAVPLVLTNDLTITNGRIDANDQDVTIGNLLTVQNGAEYDPGANTTFFNGSSLIQQIRLNGATPLVGGGFNNLALTSSNTTKTFAGDLATVVVLGDLTVGSGVTLDDNGKIIQVNGDISHSGSHITDSSSPGRIEVTGGSASHEIGGDGTGQFKILNINDGANAVAFTANQEVDSVLNLIAGVLDLDIHMLTVNSTATNPILDDIGGTGNFSAIRMIQTAGNASDGGLNYYFDGLTADPIGVLFPIGTNANAVVRYTPALVDLNAIVDDGFVRIRTSDTELQTVDLTALATNMLTYYWRVSHSDFETLPTVDAHVFTTVDSDDPDAGATPAGLPVNFVPGKVLDESPFTRSQETTPDISGFDITFNSAGAGFTLENANYTAGDGTTSLFSGSPEVYYSRAISGAWWEWQTVANWSTDAVNQHLGASATDYPQVGDIAVVGSVYVDALGCDPCTDSGTGRHQIRIDDTVGDVDVAEIVFDSQAGGTALNVTDMSRVRVRGAITLTAGKISGRGEMVQDVGTVPQTGTIVADLGEFVADNNNGWFFWFQSVTDVTISDRFDYPIFRSFGADGRLDFSQDVTAFGTLVDNGTTMSVTTNWTVDSLVQIGSNGSGTLEFPNLGSSVTLECGTLVYSDDAGNNISVENAGSDVHRLVVNRDISLEAGTGFDLTSPAGAQVELELADEGTHSLVNSTGVTPELYRIIMNKGTDQTSTFTINNDFNLNGTASGSTKALEMQNGTLILNDAGIDITLNSGNGDFTIPAEAGLTLQAGTARVTAPGSGIGNGLRLDGKVTLSGGDLILDGGASADNFIEYGTGGASEIEITSGNLVVGSQLRRNVLSGDGVINYTQSGGTAVFGVNTAPEDSRGVFEIINTGPANTSSFNLSGASTVFAIVGAQTSPEQGTFILGSDVDVSVASDAIIDFGFNGSVAGVTVQNGLGETYEINSASALPNVRIDNANFNSPIVELVVQDHTITDNLEILNGGTLASNNFNLTVNDGFTNDGTYTPGTNTTIFNGATQTIQGTTSTIFNNLNVNPATSLTLSSGITVNGDLSILSGLFDDAGNRISLLGNLSIVTEHVSDGTGTGGISLDASSIVQEINLTDGAAEIDFLRINNPEGVTINDNSGAAVVLTLDDQLAIDQGVLQIGDNRLLLDDNLTVTTSSSFDETRMISVNGVKKSDGVERQFLASTNSPAFTIPIGTPGKYTPVTLDVDASDDPGSILVKPINAIHPSATGLDALNYYWLVTTDPSSVSNFVGDIAFEYLEEDANNVGQMEGTWENNAARLIAPNWSKPSGNLVNITTNTITFSNTDLSAGGVTTFDGEYTVGNDIPDLLAIYRSNSNNTWVNTASWDVDRDGDGLYDEGNGDDDPVDEIPQPGTIVIINTGDEITMASGTDNDQNIFSLEILGILDVVDSDGHNFGDVSGSGTLRISNSTLPGGNYDNFFTTSAGSLDLSGIGSYTISPDFASGVSGLTISGGGVKTLPALTLNIGAGGIAINDGATLNNAANNNTANVAGDVLINNGTFLLGSASASINAQNLTLTTGTFTSTGAAADLSGDLNVDGGTFDAGSGVIAIEGDVTLAGAATFNNDNGTITLDGTGAQNITGDFSSETLNNLRINKATGEVVLAASALVSVDNLLTLDGGNINTQAAGATLRLLNGVGSIARTSGFISGPLQVDLNDNDAFSFPVGKASTFKAAEIDIQDGSQSVNPLTWEIEYYIGSAAGFSSGENSGIDLSSIETNADADEQVDNVNPSEYWRIDSFAESATLESITLDISNVGINADNINDQQLQVMVWDNAGAEWDHLGGVSSGTPSSANVVSSLPQTFSEHIFTSGAEADVPLPVELLEFYGVAENGEVILQWSTASELNNDYFEIQHSLDGEQFTVLGRVVGNGTTNSHSKYSLIDKQPRPGVNFYRLMQVDYDGTSSDKGTIRVESNFYSKTIEATVYPNPATSSNLNVTIRTGDDHTGMHLKIVDLTGKVYVSKSVAPRLQFSERLVPKMELKPGIYLLQVVQGDNKSARRIVIK